MRKWRDMERQMAPKSQTFSHGGIRRRDWFSDRLDQKKRHGRSFTLTAFPSFLPSPNCNGSSVFLREMSLPVESVAHLDGDEHGQGHGHRVGRLEHAAVQALKVWVVWAALEEVPLQGGRGTAVRRRRRRGRNRAEGS